MNRSPLHVVGNSDRSTVRRHRNAHAQPCAICGVVTSRPYCARHDPNPGRALKHLRRQAEARERAGLSPLSPGAERVRKFARFNPRLSALIDHAAAQMEAADDPDVTAVYRDLIGEFEAIAFRDGE